LIQDVLKLVTAFLMSRSFWNFRLKGAFQVEFILRIPFTSLPMGTAKRLVVTVGGGALLRHFVLCCEAELQSVDSWFSLGRLGRRQPSLCSRCWL